MTHCIQSELNAVYKGLTVHLNKKLEPQKQSIKMNKILWFEPDLGFKVHKQMPRYTMKIICTLEIFFNLKMFFFVFTNYNISSTSNIKNIFIGLRKLKIDFLTPNIRLMYFFNVQQNQKIFLCLLYMKDRDD